MKGNISTEIAAQDMAGGHSQSSRSVRILNSSQPPRDLHTSSLLASHRGIFPEKSFLGSGSKNHLVQWREAGP